MGVAACGTQLVRRRTTLTSSVFESTTLGASALLADQATTESRSRRWRRGFFIDEGIVARASSDKADTARGGRPHVFFGANLSPRLRKLTRAPATTTGAADHVKFDLGVRNFLARTFNLKATTPKPGRMVLASSLDRALAPLRRLQRQILITAVVACLIAIMACRFIAAIISLPIHELSSARGDREGQFRQPVQIRLRDELGTLADSFNEMARASRARRFARRARQNQSATWRWRGNPDGCFAQELPTCPGYDMAAFFASGEQTGGRHLRSDRSGA